jgi:hypothetical protein
MNNCSASALVFWLVALLQMAILLDAIELLAVRLLITIQKFIIF